MNPTIGVACGVLRDADGRILFAQRPVGKIASGYWEFPGGKIEPGEMPLDALRRELVEELDVRITAAQPLIRFQHAYSSRNVVLDTWLVTAFEGAPRPLEGQALAWRLLAEGSTIGAMLPTVSPILRALSLAPHYVFTPPEPVEPSPRQLRQLPVGALLRLRWPALDDDHYRQWARRWLSPAQDLGLRVVLDRDPADVTALSADGWHCGAARLHALRSRPSVPLAIASVHSAAELTHAESLCFDAAVLGTVCATPSHAGGATLGWDGFTACRGHSALTVYAIGGLNAVDLETARSANAQGVAGIRTYWRD